MVKTPNNSGWLLVNSGNKAIVSRDSTINPAFFLGFPWDKITQVDVAKKNLPQLHP